MLKHLKHAAPHHTFMYVWVAGGVLVLATLLVAYMASHPAPGAPACQEDALVCPDGTTLYREAPACAFPACPTVSEVETNTSFSVPLGESVKALGVSVRPLEVLEDSRCPTDVTCIQAGTVRVRALVVSARGTGEEVFSLGSAIVAEDVVVTLTDVWPLPEAGVATDPDSYTFAFTIEKQVGN